MSNNHYLGNMFFNKQDGGKKISLFKSTIMLCGTNNIPWNIHIYIFPTTNDKHICKALESNQVTYKYSCIKPSKVGL
jgi:hypothetical protein